MTGIHQSLAVWALALLLVAGAFGGGVYAALKVSPQALSAAAYRAGSVTPAVALDPAALRARAAVLYDLQHGRVLYQKNANEQLPLASLTKLMAAQAVLSVKDPLTPVLITQADVRTEGNSGMRAGETMTLDSLIKLALVASSNDAIVAAAGSLGSDPIGAMNAAARSLGLTKTVFYNATGLDVSASRAGAYGSAYDVARLAALFYADHPDFFELTTLPDVQVDGGNKEIDLAATTLPLQSIPGFVAAKTGYTDLAGGNVVAVFDLEPGLTVVAAVLGSTFESRFDDIKTLIEAARKSL